MPLTFSLYLLSRLKTYKGSNYQKNKVKHIERKNQSGLFPVQNCSSYSLLLVLSAYVGPVWHSAQWKLHNWLLSHSKFTAASSDSFIIVKKNVTEWQNVPLTRFCATLDPNGTGMRVVVMVRRHLPPAESPTSLASATLLSLKLMVT